MVNSGDHLPLSFAVWEWKFQSFHGCISLLSPGKLIRGPFMVLIHQILIPFLQFSSGDRFPESSDFLRIKLTICHLDINPFQIMGFHIDPAITECLCTMDRHRSFQTVKAFVDSLDLIDTDSFVLCKNTISSSLYTQNQIFIFTFFFERNFCLIGAAHLFLDLSVKAAALEHGFFVCCRSAPACQITASQNKFYQIPN